jgi:hypothetical protein
MTEAIWEAGSWIYKMLFTLIIAIVLVATVGIFINTQVNSIDIQREVMRNRILFDPHSIWLVENGVLRVGVLDPARFEQRALDEAFVYPRDYGGAKLTLIDGASQTVRYINEPTFTQISTATTIGVLRGGTVETHVYPVVIGDTARRNGYLVVSIAMPETT